MKNVDLIIKALENEYPDSKTSLDFKNPFQLLVATILSAQSTDKAVNKITPDLFKKYPDAISMAKINDTEELIPLIKTIGLYNNKSKNLIAMAKSLVELYDGKVPNSLKDLLKLRGVGRKTATAVLANAFGIIDQGITVDTHMMRITKRLGWTNEEKNNALKIERDLMQIIPPQYWGKITHLVIDHGRAICSAKKPKCDKCVIENYCKSSLLK